MQTIKDNKSLAAAIAHLENVHASEENLLKQHFKFTIHSFNPINIIKEKFSETFSSPIFKNELVQGTLGIATGMLTNSLIVGSSSNLIQKALGSLIQSGISRMTIKPEGIKNTGISFLKNVLSKMKIGA